jgi:hypothetical protein
MGHTAETQMYKASGEIFQDFCFIFVGKVNRTDRISRDRRYVPHSTQFEDKLNLL